MKLFRQVAFALALASVIGFLTYTAVSKYVLHKAEENLRSIMLSHRSFHNYIQRVMHPTYYKAREEGRIAADFYAPEILSSSYVARVMHGLFNEERKKEGLPPVYYKLAATNPRNPVNKADDKEAALIAFFNSNRHLKEYSEIQSRDGLKELVYARPFLENNVACIRCHGKREQAPVGLQAIYPGEGGFNENIGVIRAIESIRVPIDEDILAALVATAFSLSAVVILSALYLFNLRLRQRVQQGTEALHAEIRERRAIQDALAVSEENYRRFSVLTSDYVHKCVRSTGTSYRIQWMGGAVNNISGYSADEMFERGCWLTIVHPKDSAAMAEALESMRPGDVRELTFRIVTKNGSVRWISDKCRCEMGDSEGELVIYGAASDITEKVAAEETLQFTRVTVNAVSDAIFWATPEGDLVDVNDAACRMLGYTREELLQMSIPDVDPQATRQDIPRQFQELREQGTLRFESTHRTKQGREYPVEIGANYVRHGEVERNCGIARDMTDRKRHEEERLNLEKQLLHAQKLESLGVLAGGIAHDFNNLLTSIVGNTDLALMRLNREAPVRENLHRIEQAANRAADLAKQMLAYSGKGRFIVEPIDLSRLVEEMTKMLDISISKKCLLRYNFGKALPMVEADATQLRQIVMNLVINASEAIGEKSGVIAISTGCMQCDRRYLNSVWLNEQITEGLYVWLEVADTGCGMDKETASRIFDPFFTTKFTGRGLGMAAVLGIVRGHKGAIKVYSEPGRGTTFKILLPAGECVAELFDGGGEKEEQWKGSGTVLLVDDEETVIGIGTEMLKELGFGVLSALNGKEALDVFCGHREEIGYVILDLTMPQLDGEQTFRELRRIQPDVTVVMSSGYNEQEVTQRFAGKGLAGFIQKPYKLSTLRRVMSSVERTSPPAPL